MFGIQVALSRVRDDLPNLLCSQTIEQMCRDLGHTWRGRVLDPSTTLFAFLTQVLHGNTACCHLPHLLGRKFTASAYCQARARLPLAVFDRLLSLFHAFLPPASEGKARWHGHRTFYVDGSACHVPDTAELDEHFGRPSGVRQGGGFPMGSIVALFDATTGLLLSVVTSRFRTSELRQVGRMHHQLHAGDVLVGDSAYGYFVHLALLIQQNLHGVFRLSSRFIVDFTPERPFCLPTSPARGQRLPRSRWLKKLGKEDHLVEYHRPHSPSAVIDIRVFWSLPDSIVVRELRYRVKRPGFRTRQVTLVTTLVDADRYPKTDLAKLYCARWQVEVNFRYLNTTLRMKSLKCRSVEGVLKEVLAIAIIYNLVRLVMMQASARLRVPPEQISFIDSLRWLASTVPSVDIHELKQVAQRPNRFEPRRIKMGRQRYPWLQKPRAEYRQDLIRQGDAA